MADLLIDGVHGRYIPLEFCRRYSAALEHAGLGAAGRAVVRTFDLEDQTPDDLENMWSIWQDIVNEFSTEDGATLWESPEGLFLIGADEEVPEMF